MHFYAGRSDVSLDVILTNNSGADKPTVYAALLAQDV